MKTTYGQNTFTTGQVSVEYQARADHDRYASSLKELKNGIALPQGAVTKRPGTKYVGTLSGVVRLIPFHFSRLQAYMLVFTEDTIQFAYDGEILLDGLSPYEVATTYKEEDLPLIKYVQSADVLFLFCPGHKIKQLRRNDVLDFTLSDFETTGGPYLDVNIDSGKTLTIGTAGAVDTTTSLTASGTGFEPFTEDWVGRLVRLERAGKWRSLEITAYTSSTVVTGTWLAANPASFTAGATTSWRWGAWSELEDIGYPTIGKIYQQRLVLANNAGNSNRIWVSRTNDYYNFEPTEEDGTIIDSNAFDFLIPGEGVDGISWLESGKVISVGTAGGEFSVRAGSVSSPEPITPTSLTVSTETKIGSSPLSRTHRPNNNAIVFFDLTTRRIMEYIYAYQSDGYEAPELTILARNITESGVVASCFTHDMMWFCRNDGLLCSMVYQKDQKVVNFSEHPLGGVDAKVLDVQSLYSADGKNYEVWMVVSRTVDGGTVITLEVLRETAALSDVLSEEEIIYTDASVTYNGVAVTELDGLDHLEGEFVSIRVNGTVLEPQEVVSGKIPLVYDTSNGWTTLEIVAGLAYNFKITTLDPAIPVQTGTTVGIKKQLCWMKVILSDTGHLSVSSGDYPSESLIFDETDLTMGIGQGLHSGIYQITPFTEVSEELSVTLNSDYPTPVTILAIIYHYDIKIGEE
jgi:hypothetical protein